MTPANSDPVKHGWVAISSEPNSPLGFVNSDREIGSYASPTDFLNDKIETILVQSHLRSSRQIEHDRQTLHTWLRSRNVCSGHHVNYTWSAPEQEDVLQYMLQEVETWHSARYGEFLRCPGRFKELKDRILPRAWEFLKSKDYSREK